MRLPKGLSVVEFNQYTIAKLYNTNIVELDNTTGCLKLRTGGWWTRHTKKCINLIINKHGINLVQEKFKWKLYRNSTKLGEFQNDTLEVYI